jgi:hypothetical protein
LDCAGADVFFSVFLFLLLCFWFCVSFGFTEQSWFFFLQLWFSFVFLVTAADGDGAFASSIFPAFRILSFSLNKDLGWLQSGSDILQKPCCIFEDPDTPDIFLQKF